MLPLLLMMILGAEGRFPMRLLETILGAEGRHPMRLIETWTSTV
jgi:hypothetical protein